MTSHGRWIGTVIGALLVLAGCAPQEGGPGEPDDAARRAQLDAVRAEIGLAPDGPLACDTDDPQAFVRLAKVEGDNCLNYKVQIGGYTEACVQQRDDGARLRALRRVAAMECQRFCQGLGCTNSALVRQDDCASANAFRADDCPGECPLLNYCTLLGTTDLQNCICAP